MSVTLSERAVKEVKRVLEDQKMPIEDHQLRVAVAGGGCSGFSYKLEFEKKENGDALNDIAAEIDGLTVVVDQKSHVFLDGTEVDYHEGLEARGFAFKNPNATKSCGCGSSFSC